MRAWLLALTCAVALAGGNRVLARPDKGPAREVSPLATLSAPSPDKARAEAAAWLGTVGKTDPATRQKFDSLWKQDGRPVLDRVAATLSLGDPKAAELLEEANDPLASAPTDVPAVLKDKKRPAFYRANLGLAYAKALSNRRVYEEALDALKLVKADQVVDPAAYFFHRAVAEHALLLKNEAQRSVIGLLEDVADAPDRYKVVGLLMVYDMQLWRDKDLGEIARKMGTVERRLDLARGGPKTQKVQREVVARLDEIIKKLENQMKGNCNGGN